MTVAKEFKSFAKSTAIVLVLAGFLGLGGFLFHSSFWAFFAFGLFVQYMLYFFAGDMIKNSAIQKTRQLELEKLESLSTILQCAYCTLQNLVVFTPNQEERIEFECERCQKKNLVSIQFVVARTTEPLNNASLTNISFANEK